MEQKTQMITPDHFVTYARFIAAAASTALYDLRLEQYANLLFLETEKWNLLSDAMKARYAKHTEECKMTPLYWVRLFSKPYDLKDEIFVFKCKRWVCSYLHVSHSKEEFEQLKAAFTLSTWLLHSQELEDVIK